ncbi:MAG: hypothetical protein ACI8WB_006147 [Phenylobacterium sp.]|jgi:uncharacterized protein (DUF2384 family)
MQLAASQQIDLKKVAKVAIKMFFNICQQWDLTSEQMQVLLGEPSTSLFYKYKRGDVSSLPKDTLERISYLSGVYKALHIIFENECQANSWIKRPSADFNSKSALNIMLGGNVVDLAGIRKYLDSQAVE